MTTGFESLFASLKMYFTASIATSFEGAARGGFAGGVASLFFDRLKKGNQEDEGTYTSQGVRPDHT